MYDTLAGVYEFLVDDAVVTPEGMVAALEPWVAPLAPGARVLDCACGTGTFAVGLALRGFAVAAGDVSPGMVARTRELAAERGVAVDAAVRSWEAAAPDGAFDAVFCVGNALVHAPGRAARRAALRAMAGAVRPGGPVVVTSRNWEALRERRPRLELGARLVSRGGRTGVTARSWTIPDAWEEEHAMDVAVGIVAGDGSIETHAERLALWPFRRVELREDLTAAGLQDVADTWAPGAGRWAATARRPLSAA